MEVVLSAGPGKEIQHFGPPVALTRAE